MRTENDLRDAVRERADRAPERVPAPGRARDAHRRVSRRTGVAIAAAAVVVAAVAIVPVVVHVDHGSKAAAAPTPSATTSGAPAARSTAPAPAALPLLVHPSTWLSYSGAGVIATYAGIEAQYIDLQVGPRGSTAYHGVQVREITAYAPGLFTTALIKHPKPIEVNGVRGYFGAVRPWDNDDLPHAAAHPKPNPQGSKYADPLPAVVWPIGGNQWASVISTEPGEGTAAALMAIAAKVHVVSAPVRTPLRVGYLPPGEKLSEVDYAQANGEYAGTSSLLGFRRDTDQDYWNWDISYAPPDRASAGGTPIDPVLSRKIGTYVVTVDTRGAISAAQAKRVLASISIAPQPHAPNGTWFTLADALP
jgi:hypothetical protein